MKLLKQIETLFQGGTTGGQSDAQLLERFVERRDETAEDAFAALVDRHEAMVLRVCRQVLREDQDAQDAAQATFLVLARRAGSISRRESVASWLHGVALRVAARARLADARRRARERRGGAIMAASQIARSELDSIEEIDRWIELHAELERLPESFRSPLVLCYLEGLTQEQAAAQLRCPLGTVQSRLARGRTKLKARLTQSSAEFWAAVPGAAIFPSQHAQVPPARIETTVRLATQFAGAKSSAIAGGGTTAAVLARAVLQAMAFTKLKVATGWVLLAAVLTCGAVAWAMPGPDRSAPPAIAIPAALAAEKPQLEPAEKKAPAQPEVITRKIRGTVRDEQGRPIPKVWVGDHLLKLRDNWELVYPLARIRERKEPFRDRQGKIVPPGEPGRYFEVRDEAGKWLPADPADIRRHDPSDQFARTIRTRDVADAVSKALAGGREVFEIRTAKNPVVMTSLLESGDLPHRTDAEGHFDIKFTMFKEPPRQEVNFASADLTRQAMHVVLADDPDEPLEIILKPVRTVRASLIETPVDLPEWPIDVVIYAADASVGNHYFVDAIREKGAEWDNDLGEDHVRGGSRETKRRFEARLPEGRYKLRFRSYTFYRVVDVAVPPGDGPVDLPDIHLERMAWVKMLGKPAGEIQAIDLEGKPATLAGYRGKMVVLHFWTSATSPGPNSPRTLDDIRDSGLTEIQRRFAHEPVAILALHDASLSSLARYKQALSPLREQLASADPIHFLLDRPPIGNGRGPFSYPAGEARSGRTADTYESFEATFVIDKTGRMVLAIMADFGNPASYTLDADGGLVYEAAGAADDDDDFVRKYTTAVVTRALEDALGLRRSIGVLPTPKKKAPEPLPERAPAPKAPLVVKGRVVDVEGRPITGAEVENELGHMKKLKTGPAGDFSYVLTDVRGSVEVTVAATGMATRRFQFRFPDGDKLPARVPEPLPITLSGLIPDPLRMSPGATVTGRLVRDGKPAAGVTVVLDCAGQHEHHPVFRKVEATTDRNGEFRLPHALPATEFWVKGKLGTVQDHGVVIPVRIRTGDDGSTLDAGVLDVQSGRTLAGRVIILSDGKAPALNAKLFAVSANAGWQLEWKLDDRGRFEFKGLPDGEVSLTLSNEGGESAPLRYGFSPKNKCRDPDALWLTGQLDHDILDLTILLEPTKEPEGRIKLNRDDTAIADFNDAKAGPITGVPPGDYPPK
jgi:RNA polymerase sigma factor (sigma-70 family)